MFTNNVNKNFAFTSIILLLLTSCNAPSLKSADSYNEESFNLTVEIYTKNYQHNPLPFIKFESLVFDCYGIGIHDQDDGHIIGEELPSTPKEWCGEEALNVPITTDENGYAKAFFHIEPDPTTINIVHDANLEGPLPYQLPMMNYIVGTVSGGGRIFATSNNEWIYTAYFNIPNN